MLKDWVPQERPEAEEIEARLEVARAALAARQMVLKEKKVPVLVLFEGWGTAGKGSVLGKVIKNMDPRFYKTETFSWTAATGARFPFLHKYFVRIPQEGKFSFYDGSWMDEVTKQFVRDEMSVDQYRSRLNSIRRFERQLGDNGYLVVKFFFHITKKEQKKRLEQLLEDESTRWRVSEWDKWQNKHYEECVDAFDMYLDATNQFNSPWFFIDSQNKKWAELQVLEILVKNIDTALENIGRSAVVLQNTFPLKRMPLLSEVDLSVKADEATYDEELKKLQTRLAELHNVLYLKKIPVIIAYEGWDAAGKGGNIKRVTAALDPRGFEVHPIASPEPAEKSRHYLWRFWNRLPRSGHIAVFDRTWYGRVMVERLEGFCSENDWQRAYNEINEFEKELTDWGAVVVKFWVQIDKETQLERFNERQNTPEKQWKITDEDWRNREKWDQYEVAVNEMLQKTSTEFAPWYILESNDKHYARLKALKILIDVIEKRLKAE